MNKLQLMKQKDIPSLLDYYVTHYAGVTSLKLFEACKEWAGSRWDEKDTWDFEQALANLRTKGFYCTNKQWYPKGWKAEPKQKGPSKADPRQTRMF